MVCSGMISCNGLILTCSRTSYGLIICFTGTFGNFVLITEDMVLLCQNKIEVKEHFGSSSYSTNSLLTV